MQSSLSINIGRNSAGIPHKIDLISLPNLVISYNEKDQLAESLYRFIKDLSGIQSVLFATSIGNKLAKSISHLEDNTHILFNFLHEESPDAHIKSIDQFIDFVAKEFKSRKRIQKSSPTLDLPPLVVIIDNIFEVILSNRKKTALLFIEMLANCPSQSVYFIIGSSGMYKNLLDQIIHLNPLLRRKLEKSNPGIKINEPLAAEMIINPDGLIFFRKRGEKVYLRLYPV